MKTPSIEEVAEATKEKCPYYFDKDTLRFFGQTLRSFKVSDNGDGRFKISAPSYWWINGEKKLRGYSERLFNPATNDLEDLPETN